MSALPVHTVYVAAAYIVAALVLVGLVLWAALSYRSRRRALGELEERLGLRTGPRGDLDDRAARRSGGQQR